MTSALLARRFEQSTDVPGRFFEAQADAIARACLEMARRFRRGGRLLVFGEGAQASDARHVSVEFVHPVIVGKRALPAWCLASVRQLDLLGRDHDIAMAISVASPSAAVSDAFAHACRRGMLTLALTGNAGATGGDFVFAVPSDDPMVVQEVHETLYHVLWELVHVFFEHRAV